MPVPVARSNMLPLEEIVRTAVREHPDPMDGPLVLERTLDVLGRGSARTPPYSSRMTPQLQVCRFRCMLQDTGYPLEVYMPPGDEEANDSSVVDWSTLKERWVGWGVEVPGEQPWVKEALDGVGGEDVAEQLGALDINGASGSRLPEVVHGKWPLQGGEYQGALIKIYDPNISFRPGTAYEFIGLLSQSNLPTSSEDFFPPSSGTDDERPEVLVPCLHVLTEPYEVYPLNPAHLGASEAPVATRDQAIDYLAELLPRDTSGQPDRMAAEVLLLALIARVTSKAPGSVPLGTLSLNLLLPRTKAPADTATTTPKEYPAFSHLVHGIQKIQPLVLDIPLSINLLNTHPFFPRSAHVIGTTTPATAGESLQAGLLQLAPSTVVLINEDTLEGGALQDRGVKNLHALAEVVRTQKLRYEFPYVSEDFGMETDLGFVVVGQGKSLLPVDLHMPLLGLEPPSTTAAEHDPQSIARFLVRTRAASGELVIPSDVADFIQAEFIRLRKEGLGRGTDRKKIEVGEADLRNWMRMGRLLALSYPGATFSKQVWDRVLEIDLERKIRMDAR